MKDNPNSLIEQMSVNEVEAISNRIIYLRKTVLKLSQIGFSKITGISQPYLSQLETNQKTINMSVALQISKNLKVNLDWLLYGIGEDSNIFTTVNDSLEASRDIAIQNLIAAYSLNTTDEEFLSWYLSLNPIDRKKFTDSLSSLASLCNV